MRAAVNGITVHPYGRGKSSSPSLRRSGQLSLSESQHIKVPYHH